MDSVLGTSLRLLLRKMKDAAIDTKPTATPAIPIPIPNFAPLDSPVEELDSEADAGDVLLATPERVEICDVEVVVVAGNKVRSDCAYSTDMGCPHIVMGPLTTVDSRSVSLTRPGTVVVPSNVLMQPIYNDETESW